MIVKSLFLLLLIPLFFGLKTKEASNSPAKCKQYFDGVFVYDPRNPNDFVARTDTSIIEVYGGNTPYMVKYKVRWEKNGCDHDLIYERTTPSEMEKIFKKGDVVHIKVKETSQKYVSFTATYKEKVQQTGMYRIE